MFCPAILVAMCCNNDIKLITNGEDTKDVMWYTTAYQSKKQGKNYNISALMANTLLYHNKHSDHLENILDQNWLLMFCCQHAINQEMEMSAPQVMSYLMKWGDSMCLHCYVPLYWSPLGAYIFTTFNELKPRRALIA